MSKLRVSVLCVLAFSAWSCGKAPAEQASELDYIRFGSGSWGLSRKVHTAGIKFCIRGADTEENRRTATLAIKAWLAEIRYLDDTATDQAVLSCESPDVTMNWKTYEGRASTSTGQSTSSMTLYSNSQYRTVLHELGHSFGLGDTYFAEGGERFEPTARDVSAEGNGDKPESVMKLGRYGSAALYPDDIEGIQSILMLIEQGNGTSFGAEEACTTADNETGVRRSINRGQRYSGCRPTTAFHEAHYEPTYSACTNGELTHGLYDAGLAKWLPGFSAKYACSK